MHKIAFGDSDSTTRLIVGLQDSPSWIADVSDSVTWNGWKYCRFEPEIAVKVMAWLMKDEHATEYHIYVDEAGWFHIGNGCFAWEVVED